MDRNERLRRNYKRLRDAGFSSAEASRLRSASEEIRQAIKTRTMPMKDPYRQAAGKGQTADTTPPGAGNMGKGTAKEEGAAALQGGHNWNPPTNIIKGHIKYEKSGTGDIPHYLSRYTYKLPTRCDILTVLSNGSILHLPVIPKNTNMSYGRNWRG